MLQTGGRFIMASRDWQCPVTVSARSGAWTVFAFSNVGVVGSNPTWGMDVCVRLFCVCAVCKWRPCDGLTPRPRSPTDYVKRARNWKIGQSPTKGCRTIDRQTEIGNEKITLSFKVLLISERGSQVYKVGQWELKSYQLHWLFPTSNKLHKFKPTDVWCKVPDSYSR
jgi:hypothetical protein